KNEEAKTTDNDKKQKNDQLQVETSVLTNKRKLGEGQEIDLKITALSKKAKNENECKLERWESVKDSIDVYDEYMKFILQEEETYEPPHDDDTHTSLFDSGMKFLTQMDRVTAIEDDLVEFLKPFDDSGKTVTEQDVRAFFE
ncbi:3967_t:CDS:2, partial [Racocetra fulgida]